MRRDEPDDLDARPVVDARAMRDALAVTARPVESPPAWTYARPGPSPCIVCGRLAAILHALPEERKRTACAECQGKAARDRLLALADAVRTFKSSDEESECAHAEATILRLDNFGRETVNALRAWKLARKAAEATKAPRGFK